MLPRAGNIPTRCWRPQARRTFSKEAWKRTATRSAPGLHLGLFQGAHGAGNSGICWTLPLTGKGVVDRIVTDLDVMDAEDDGLHINELAPGMTKAFVQSKTEVALWLIRQLVLVTRC